MDIRNKRDLRGDLESLEKRSGKKIEDWYDTFNATLRSRIPFAGENGYNSIYHIEIHLKCLLPKNTRLRLKLLGLFMIFDFFLHYHYYERKL